jgi:hypothetical protein
MPTDAIGGARKLIQTRLAELGAEAKQLERALEPGGEGRAAQTPRSAKTRCSSQSETGGRAQTQSLPTRAPRPAP